MSTSGADIAMAEQAEQAEQAEPMVGPQTGSLRRSQAEGHGSLLRTHAQGSRTSSLQRASGLQGSLPRSGNSDGGQAGRRSLVLGARTLTVGRHCERDTRFFSGLLLVLLVFQLIHGSYLSYFNGRVHKVLSLKDRGLTVSQVLFPLCLALSSVPASMWLMASAWDLCSDGTMGKMRSKRGFIAYQVSIVLSTAVYVGYLVFLMVTNFRGYYAAIGREAACYCSDVTDHELGIPRDTYHCECLVPEEPPWHVATTSLSLVDAGSLQRRGSNYSGPVSSQLYNSSRDRDEAAQTFFPDFKNMVNLLELSLLTLPVRMVTWGWTSEYAWRDMAKLPASVTSAALQTNLAGLLAHALYSLGDGLDSLALLSYLVQGGRDLTVHRSTTAWVLATVSIVAFVVHLVLPLAFVQFCPNYGNVPFPRAASSRVTVFLGSPRSMAVVVRLVSVVTNVLLLVLRAVLYREHGGRFGVELPNSFLLFIIKEVYVAIQKGFEFCIQLWEIRRGI